MLILDELFSFSRLWSGVVIHHSATKDGQNNDWTGIRLYHIKEKGWRDIGYHFGIEEVEGHIIYRIGRSLDEIGGHCLGFNNTHIGICLVGDYDSETPKDMKYFLLASLVREIQRITNIKKENVIGHWESFVLLNQAKTKEEAQLIKTCPGKMFDMDYLRGKIL